MKVYKNKHTAKEIGVKFDSTRMATITVDGDIGTVATIKFVDRDRKVAGDLNADPDYIKEYDINMFKIFADMLGVCDADMTACFKMEYNSSDESYRISKVEDSIIHGFDALAERLMCILCLFA